jgi:hypothetical protein
VPQLCLVSLCSEASAGSPLRLLPRSGDDPGSCGCLLEATHGGKQPLVLPLATRGSAAAGASGEGQDQSLGETASTSGGEASPSAGQAEASYIPAHAQLTRPPPAPLRYLDSNSIHSFNSRIRESRALIRYPPAVRSARNVL